MIGPAIHPMNGIKNKNAAIISATASIAAFLAWNLANGELFTKRAIIKPIKPVYARAANILLSAISLLS